MTDIPVNSKFRCNNCGSIQDLGTLEERARPCRSCGALSWDQIRMVPMCDFCGLEETDSWWRYPARDFAYTFQIPGMPQERSRGDWAACAECHETIKVNDRRLLAQRSLDVKAESDPAINRVRHEIFTVIRMAHEDFFRNRTGDPVKEGQVMS